MPLSSSDRAQMSGLRGDIEDLKAVMDAVKATVFNWPAGTTFTDRRTLAQDASGGDLAVRFTPATAAAADEFRFLGGVITNGDVASRPGSFRIFNASNQLIAALLFGSAIGSAGSAFIPSSGAGPGAITSDHAIVSGTNYFEVRLESMTALEDAIFATMFRCRGANPIVTEVIA